MTWFRIIWIGLFAGLTLLSGCVSNRKSTLLQHGDLHVKQLPTDSLVRSYPVDSFSYRVQAHDILSVRFESLTPAQFDFLSREREMVGNVNLQGGAALVLGDMVDENGNIPFPVLGKVKVAGLSLSEVQERLQFEASKFLDSPVVKVSLLNFRVTVLGEVAQEGTVLVTNSKASILEVIAMAGGLGEFADRANIKLIRQRNGQTEVQYINLLDENFLASPYFFAVQNDVLIIPPLKQKPFRRYFGQNLSLVVSTLSLLLLAFNLTK